MGNTYLLDLRPDQSVHLVPHVAPPKLERLGDEVVLEEPHLSHKREHRGVTHPVSKRNELAAAEDTEGVKRKFVELLAELTDLCYASGESQSLYGEILLLSH